MAIEMVKIRAEITMGSLIAGTPPLDNRNHILSFNVDKARGQISSFSASLKVHADDMSGGLVSNADVQIRAGEGSPSNLIFTGLVRSATVTPCRDDPEFVIMNINGNDVLSRLQGKKFTRRCRSTKGLWVTIDSVTRPGLRDGRFMYVPGEQYLSINGGKLEQEDPVTNTREQTLESNVETLPSSDKTNPIILEFEYWELGD